MGQQVGAPGVGLPPRAAAGYCPLMADEDLVSVTVDGDGPTVCLKLQSARWEINVHGTRDEFSQLSGIDETDWAARRVINIGSSAGSPTHWCIESSDVVMLIGPDDETWDVALSLQRSVIDQILATLAADGPTG